MAAVPQAENGGSRGIRTPGGVAPTTVFKTVTLNRSVMLPFDFVAEEEGFEPPVGLTLRRFSKPLL
jgi:hypothetical protein